MIKKKRKSITQEFELMGMSPVQFPLRYVTTPEFRFYHVHGKIQG